MSKNHPFLGKTRSEEFKTKISNTLKGKTSSEETKKKMSDAWLRHSQKGNSNSKNQPTAIKIEVTDLLLNSKTVYDSINAATRALKINSGIISKYFNRGAPGSATTTKTL
jgi:hypothetical protein